MICSNIDTSIQVPIPAKKSSQSFVTQMKCEATSDKTHHVLIGQEIGYKSYKEICSGEPKKVNLGYNMDKKTLEVENNSLVQLPIYSISVYIFGSAFWRPKGWEVLGRFFSIHNIQPNFLDCNWSWGWYDQELQMWTGCVGKVWGTEYWIWWLSQIIILRLSGMTQILSLQETWVVSTHEEK